VAGQPVAGSRLERVMNPVSILVVLPLFALANTGLVLDPHILAGRGARSVLLGVLVARIAGKTVGISMATFLLVRTGVTRLPEGVRRVQIVGVAALCGMGFTVPLLFAASAFAGHPRLLAAARAGLLAGTLLAFLTGGVLLLVAGGRGRGLRTGVVGTPDPVVGTPDPVVGTPDPVVGTC